MKFSVTKKFNTTVDRSSRVMEIAESFGLGLEDKEFVLYDSLEINIKPGDVIYITGQSGSGKSVILNELANEMSTIGIKVANIDQVELKEVALIDQIGENTKHAMKLLSAAGVNDAYLTLRKPSELSDGQRYRFKLAKLMEMNADVWVADEFGAVLDRPTAKAVASNLQKTARNMGKPVTVMVATTHTDLIDDLNPNMVIHKRFRDVVDIRTGLEVIDV